MMDDMFIICMALVWFGCMKIVMMDMMFYDELRL